MANSSSSGGATVPVTVRPDAVTLLCGDARAVLDTLPAQSVHTCLTSPSYFGLRDYGCAGQIGLEGTPQEYVAALVDVFRGVWRVLRDDGTLFVVLGDSYAGGKCGRDDDGPADIARRASSYGTGRPKALAKGANGVARKPQAGLAGKNLLGIPWRVAFALQDDGWILRQELIWAKPNPMPESVKDRCTRGHETVFMLAKKPTYFYDAAAIAEQSATHRDYPTWDERKAGGAALRRGDPGQGGDVCHWAGIGGNGNSRNKRSVWTVATAPLSSKKFGVDTEHYAAFPPELVRPMVRAATSERGVCPQCGAPWRRVVERTRTGTPPVCPGDAAGWAARRNGQGRDLGDDPVHTSGLHGQYIRRHEHVIGWQPACPCGAGDPVPATVLDCFMGSGTAGLVAVQEGRRFVGIDLNAAYVDLARRRIATAQPPLALALAL